MDRRGFITLFSAAALASLGPIDQLIALGPWRFSSPVLGFSFAIPRGWVTSSVEECRANLAKQTYLEDQVEPDAISPTPLTSCSRYREPHVGMNPVVYVYADHYSSWMGHTPIELTENYLDYFPKIVENGACVRTPELETWNGAQASTTAISYTATTNDGFRHDVIDRVSFVFHRDHVLCFVLEDSLHGPEKAKAEFSEVLTSMSFY